MSPSTASGCSVRRRDCSSSLEVCIPHPVWCITMNSRVWNIGPGPDARFEFGSFEPDQEWQEGEVADVYRASDGVHSYLGDWHSHTTTRPRPSQRDRSVARTISEAEAARAPEPLMMIMGVAYGRPQLAVYVLQRHLRRVRIRLCDITPVATI